MANELLAVLVAAMSLNDVSPLKSAGLHKLTGKVSGNSAQFWLNLQTRHDALETERQLGKRIESEVGRSA